jgi:hypothetical protein
MCREKMKDAVRRSAGRVTKSKDGLRTTRCQAVATQLLPRVASPHRLPKSEVEDILLVVKEKSMEESGKPKESD